MALGLLLFVIAVFLYSLQFQPELGFFDQLTSTPAEARINTHSPLQQATQGQAETVDVDVDPAPIQTAPPSATPDINADTGSPPFAETANTKIAIKGTDQLEQLFEDTTCDSKTAFSALFQLWNTEFSASSRLTPCEIAESQGLRCLHNKGTWNSLRRYNRPSIIEMQDSSGKWHHLLLSSITEDSVSLSCGDQQIQTTITQADKYWLGEYLLLWQPPGKHPQLALGDRGMDVARIQKQLMMLNNDIEAETLVVSSRFDATFKQQITAFQQEHSLTPDGIAGKDTLILLNTLAGDSAIPLLQMGDK
jgi:general secretion pathway protein A